MFWGLAGVERPTVTPCPNYELPENLEGAAGAFKRKPITELNRAPVTLRKGGGMVSAFVGLSERAKLAGQKLRSAGYGNVGLCITN